MRIARGSVAIDAVDISNCTAFTDQCGVARPQGSDCDLGAMRVEHRQGGSSPCIVAMTGHTFSGGESGSDTYVSLGFGNGTISAKLTNCIAGDGEAFRSDEVDVDHCDVESGPYGMGDTMGNISLDPVLLGDFHLDATSPCIDRGSDETASHTDLEGHGRVGTADMGAFEYGSTPSPQDPLCGAPTRNTDNGHDYWLCDRVELDWQSANLYCRVLEANLVAIADVSENTYVRDLIPASSSIWIGINDLETEGIWIRSDEKPGSYTNWDNGEVLPDGGDTEDCAAIAQSDGLWSDENCFVRRGFVCESMD